MKRSPNTNHMVNNKVAKDRFVGQKNLQRIASQYKTDDYSYFTVSLNCSVGWRLEVRGVGAGANWLEGWFQDLGGTQVLDQF